MAKPQSSSQRRRRRIRDEMIFDTIMEMVSADTTRAVRPEDIAMKIEPLEWQTELKRVRLFARQLAHEGYVAIIRKGAVVDPDDFKGVYRVRAGEKAAHYEPRMPRDE